ncbi:MAG: DNA topoisomerase III, partial [Planctomycetes bacterium]|nr:DNA topoisomerase III [Planctomycetota bacterium]
MRVVLAEKPSVARDLAAFLGARTRRAGYFEGEGWCVTWAFGHLVALKEPEGYDPAYKRWSLEHLPIVPERFELEPTGDDRAKQQFATIVQLFRAADEIVCATDAGREGELIFRYILELSGCQPKPARRLWLSSLTETAIRQAFDELRPTSEYDRLYAAARCRSEADWIVGMNATRNYTVRFRSGGVLWSVGRVQTPVLALIVERDEEIRHFRPEPWFELRTKYRDVVFKARGDRFRERDEAEAKAASIRGSEFVVTDVARREERVQPPQLFDLTALQREMNQRYGMSAQDTLKIAQSLYEQKLVTYPRTDSRYLTRDMEPDVRATLATLRDRYERAARPLDLDDLPITKRVFDDTKVDDHHAIVPTGRSPSGLDGSGARVYDAIALRLVAAFCPVCVKQVTTVDGKAVAVKFRARGVRVVEPGWTVVDPPKRSKKQDDDLDEQVMPEFERGERGAHDPEVKEGSTKPPRSFTEASLLGAMETAGKLVDDERLR